MIVQTLRGGMRSGFAATLIFILLIVLLILLGGSIVASQTCSLGNAGSSASQTLQIPVGTVLPIALNHGFTSKTAKAGQPIIGRIMQDVPLPNDAKIPEGAKVLGTIVSVAPAGSSSGGRISLRFDALEFHQQKVPIVTDLRALANFMDVQYAQTPESTPDFGTPPTWVTTTQIGGDEVYGVGGPVTDKWSQPVGTATFTGVLVHVRAHPGSKCRGALDSDDRLQALWVFSSDACGVYGIEGLTIAHAGRTAPQGEIVLAAANRDVEIRSASGLLLRVVK